MNPQINRLVKSLLKKESLEQCSLQELEQFAERHPYFGAAQLLLTKKLQAEKSERYDEQLQKTFLFFNNPLWVQHLLNETGSGEIILSEENKTPVEPVIEELPVKTDLLHIVPSEDIKTELVFEPYHTVDYFASQGIRFKEEEKPADKFSQQLKSFTDWLKTMKRLPVTEIAKTGASPLEKKVEQLAEHSLAEKEVLTEAMAEVWEKQGNTVKATEIYTKLSLLDPSKNLYFAAKIEALKKKN
ncbi:MAG: hypothetical protein ACXWV1_13090 [Chitinophagaceae bacterium]